MVRGPRLQLHMSDGRIQAGLSLCLNLSMVKGYDAALKYVEIPSEEHCLGT